MIRTLLIEDNKNAYISLKKKLNLIRGIEIVGWERTTQGSIKSIRELQPDIVFMDIQLEDGVAFEALDQLENEHFEIVFTTAYNTYYETAFKYYAFNYLLKPIDFQDLENVIHRYRKTSTPKSPKNKFYGMTLFLQEENSKILLKYGYDYIFKELHEIKKCTADGNYTKFYFHDGKSMLVSYALKYYVNLLEPKGFFRANRSHLLNIKYMKSVHKKEYIIMTDGEKIKVSTKYKEALIKIIETLT